MAAIDPLLVRLGRHLREARDNRGWSQQELAFECRLHRTYVGSVERGEMNITVLSLRRITRALEIPLTEVIQSATAKRSAPT